MLGTPKFAAMPSSEYRNKKNSS